MIERYSREPMVKIWAQENKFKIWLEIELLTLEAWVELGAIPKEVGRSLRSRAHFQIDRISKIEQEVRHDVIAFLTAVAEHVGEEARYLHKGMTSSDVLDTCFAYQLKQSAEILENGLDKLLSVLKWRAQEFKKTIRIGRSHGIHAEPTTFGLMLALFYDEFRRAKKHLQQAKEDVAVGKISGSVGTFAHVDPFVEKFVCQKLGLKPACISTQIVGRDRHANFFTTLALIATSLEKLALEIRHLQRTEVREAEEFFHKGQKGSSAMPHKRNPVLSENVCGLARMLRGYATVAMENVPLWHERDISHSSAERMIGPDATITLDFMIHRMVNVVEDLLVYPESMKKNLELTKGLYNSQRVLLALADKGMSREEAYHLVQHHAMDVWENGKDFLTELKHDNAVTRVLNTEELEGCFDLSYYLKHVETIFKRVFEK